MKLKKILAQSLAVAMVLSSVPVANFTALAAEDTAAYASDDASTVDATTDAFPAPYGYKNLQLTVGTDVKITTSANTEITESSGNNILKDQFLWFENAGDKWINYHFTTPQKISGLLYKQVMQTNGHVKIARVDVRKHGSTEYETVYQTAASSAWKNDATVYAALFGTVSDVEDVKFYAVDTYGTVTNRLRVQTMRILTTEDDSAVTATALTSDENSGTATVSIPDSTVSGTTMSVSKGVTVKYQAKEADAGKFAGWRDETGRIVSNDATYTTTVSDNITLTAVFKNYYERIDQSVLNENAKDNSHDNDGNDRAASAAFDGNDDTLWHQNWGNGAGSTDKPSASNPIWIQTSFGTENGENKVETVGRLTYRGRPDSYANKANTKGLWSTRISDYVILAANVAQGSPKTGDWAVVQTGTMPSDIAVGNAVSEVEFAPVNATHIRLVCLSTYGDDNYVCAGEINLYRVTDSTYGADLMKLNVTVNQEENGNGNAAIVAPGYQTLNDAGESGESASIVGKYMLGKPRKIQLLAVPASGYAFASWKVNNEIVSKEATYLIDTDSTGIYQPEFTQAANYAEITIPTDGGSSEKNPSNIRTNSETKPVKGNDGPAYYAFDGSEDTHWHSNWGIVVQGENEDGKISVTGPIWIEAGFNEVKNVAKITYKPRTNGNGACRAKGYEVLVAHMAKPTDQPGDADFALVKTGVLGNNAGPQDIILPTPVAATHVRLKFTSSYDGQTYVSASKIGMFEDSANADKYADIVDIPKVTSNDNTLGTVETSTQKMVDKIDNSITMTAKPAADCHFVKWLITDNETREVSEKSAKSITEIVNNKTRYAYTAMFAKDAEVNVNLDQTYVTMYVGDNAQTLEATVTNAADASVKWSTDNDQVATVNGGIVTAVGAGEATITATSVQDKTKKATCTVVVNVKPSITTLMNLVRDANTKKDETTKYTAASRSKLESVLKEVEGVVTSKDEAVIKQAENDLRDALDNLEALYVIRVNVGDVTAKAEITTAGDDGEIHRDGDGTYIYAPLMKLVTVKADATNKAGVPFLYWYLDPDSKVMSTSTSYSFYVVGEMAFSAKYDAVKTDPEVNLFCSTKYSTAAGKLSFIAKRSVDKIYTVVEHGVIITDKTGWDNYYKNNKTAMIKGATRTRKSVAKGTANIGTYEAKLKAGKKEEWHGRSYVTYTDGYKTYTEYSEIVDYPVSK